MNFYDKCYKKQTIVVRCNKADECLEKNIDCVHTAGHIKIGACEIECPFNKHAHCVEMKFEED